MRVADSDRFDPMTPSNLQEPFAFFRKATQGEASLLERAIFILDADAVPGREGLSSNKGTKSDIRVFRSSSFPKNYALVAPPIGGTLQAAYFGACFP